ncbi:glucuronate isomerase [Spelaeicoccus albus]|uniref:Uronate isomerase n=1 Tax=Spelaeicoccus albus TaxID=1280376 RepID=A0A7Z0ABM3_9MICO|nr:glucuronate isomerase [Spelaeicoccus albus]NYI66673.1 glucuronate isomerase [Spelaeicoccus albus]
MSENWRLDPDRALPADAEIRKQARAIYDEIASLPLVSMHGHVDVDLFAANKPFRNPADLLIVPDHYLVRMLVSQGYTPAELGVPFTDNGGTVAGAEASDVETDSRVIWRRFCENWRLFRGTPTRYWLEHEFAEVFGLSAPPSAENADDLYDELTAALARPEFRPLALLDSMNVEILATTDSALAELDSHAELARTLGPDRIVPTFRPDSLLHVRHQSWAKEIAQLAEVSGIATDDYAGYIRALEQRRRAFVAAGARATDHGHVSADTTPLARTEAERIYTAALRGEATAAEADAFSAHMLFEMARMSTDDGLVMQLHPGVLRNHNARIHEKYGADKGFDIPTRVEFTRSLQPMLEEFGLSHDFRCIVFTTDETVYSRELAPLAGAYPSLRLGAPWWFLDSPEQMRRFRESAIETAGFYNTSGFVDDTRAFASIPARHDLARRIDAGYLGKLVAEGRLGPDEACETAIDLTYNLPRHAYARHERNA